MRPSFQLFRLFGIQIRVHATFILLPLFLGVFYYKDYGLSVALRAFTLVLCVFIFVLIHELCHSLKAREFGINTLHITLYPMGGVASMERIPRDPGEEFIISLVGPISNFAMALILFLPFYFLIGKDNLFSPSLESWPQMAANVFWINPILGAFNLIPAFPMDGGRILRASLAKRMGHLKATRISVSIGRIFAILFFLFGVWKGHWMLVLIALFVYFSGSNELKQVLYEEFLRREHESLKTAH